MMSCDELNLTALLDANDDHIRSSNVVAQIAQHVESCEQCQRRLTNLAAGEAQWLEVHRWLSRPEHTLDVDAESMDARQRWKRPSAGTEAMAKSLLSPPKHPEMLGRLGRYDIERLIGSGGMSVVFKAYDTELNRPVAVKVLAPYLAESGSARQRFAREARAAAAIVDDHVVPILDVQSDGDEVPFLVMQYVHGGSLQQRIDRDGPLGVAEILRIGMQTAKGLAAAHWQGLIHRDVKPSNILLDEGVERALLTDFGLARAENDACLTRSGIHPGTPHYMSPEQVRGESIDARSDLFGLGCTLYALSTGHPPFRADTSYAVMRRITDESPRPIRETNADVPAWLDAIVAKLLSKSRCERFDSADEVAELLRDCLAHVQHPTTVPLPESLKQKPALASGVLGRYKRQIINALGCLLLILASTVLVIETGKGTVTIESNEAADVPIRISQDGKTVEQLTVSQAGATTRLRAGAYLIEIVDPNTQLSIIGGTVELKRGGQWIARIKSHPAQGKNTSDAPLATFGNQPKSQILFTAPQGLNVLCATSDSPTAPIVCPGRMNLAQGITHQLQLSKIPELAGANLLVSFELREATAKTKPYLDHNAIQVVFTEADFEHALSGHLMTKVIYFPNQQGALAGLDTITSTRVDPQVDPVQEATRRGTVVAVLRMGNRHGLLNLDRPTYQKAKNEPFFQILGKTTSGGTPDAVEPPSDAQILNALNENVPALGLPALLKVHRDICRIVKEKTAEYVDPPRFYPLIGLAQLHHTRYRCSIYFDKAIEGKYPVPHTLGNDKSMEEIYIDQSHFHLIDNNVDVPE